MPKATIAVIEGRVGGGGSELTLSCDMRFAALGRAVFNQPEVALGILPGGQRHRAVAAADRPVASARGDPRVRRRRRRSRRRVGLGQPLAARGRAVAVRRPAGGAHRVVPSARGRRGEGGRAARREGRRRRTSSSKATRSSARSAIRRRRTRCDASSPERDRPARGSFVSAIWPASSAPHPADSRVRSARPECRAAG